MTSFNNNDLYTMLLHRLRKDRKGAVSPEEFESFLRWRNIDKYNKMFKDESSTKYNEDALKPFLVPFEDIQLVLNATTLYYEATLSSPAMTQDYGHWANVWVTDQTYEPGGYDLTDMTSVDIVSETELQDRLTNAITGPSATHPIGYFSNTKLYIHGFGSQGYVIMSYYKLPSDPVFDYYTDASGNITYLTESQAAYTLLSGEIAKDGSTAGSAVTSLSVDLEWDDDEALDILDMIVSDVSIALSDPGSFQASLLERKEN
jgi:hypothetical protein